MLSMLHRRFKFITSAATLIFTLLLVSVYALPTARAADIVISDQVSCEAVGGTYTDGGEGGGSLCEFLSQYTVAAGDTFTNSMFVRFNSGFTNNGTMTFSTPLTIEGNTTNHGAITNNTTTRIRSVTFVNRGTITNNASSFGFRIATQVTLNNFGVINGDLQNDGTVINECVGVINGTLSPNSPINNPCTETPTPTDTFTNTATFTPTNTFTNTPVPTQTFTPTSTFTNTALPTNTYTHTPTNTFTNTPLPSNTPTSTFTPTPSGFAKAQFNHGNEISVTKSERPSIIFQYGSTTGLPLSNPRLECSVSGQATFVLPVSNNGFTTVNATATSFTLSGRAALRNGQNYSATFKVNPGATLGQISTLTCTLLGDNFAAVSDTLNIRVR